MFYIFFPGLNRLLSDLPFETKLIIQNNLEVYTVIYNENDTTAVINETTLFSWLTTNHTKQNISFLTTRQSIILY